LAQQVLHVTDTTVDGKKQQLVYVFFQKMVSYMQSGAQGPNATATFRSSTSAGNTLNRFPQCLSADTIPEGDVCLAPRLGTVTSQCSLCLVGYAGHAVSLQVTVPFADGCTDCLPRYDSKYFTSHKVFPVTNHHSPLVSTLPVVTVPRMESPVTKVSFSVHAVDEDGMGRPIDCRNTGSCNNIKARWDLGPGPVDSKWGGISSDGLILSYHSDAVQFATLEGQWIIKKRDDTDGGGLLLSVAGPLREPRAQAVTIGQAVPIVADAMYPARVVVEDVFGVQVPIEFMLRVCASIKPYQVDAAGIRLYAGEEGLIAPVMVKITQGRHEPMGGRHVCYPDQPCILTVSAVAYDSQTAQSAFFRTQGCSWGLSRRSIEGSNSTKCIDNVRSLPEGDAVSIDTSQPSLQVRN